MFVQLRRVVYLLVLLQCCACVAYAEGSENVTVTLPNAGSAEEDAVTKMEKQLQEFNMTAEQLYVNGSIIFDVLHTHVRKLQTLSGEVEFVANKTKELVEERSKPVAPDAEDTSAGADGGTGQDNADGEDTSDEDPTEAMVKDVKYIIKSVADTTEIVRLAIGYCKHWSDILDKVFTDCGEPSIDHILRLSDEDFPDMEPATIYEKLYLLKAYISAATKRGNDTVEVVKKHEKAVEGALVSLNVSNNTLKKEIEEIHDDAKKNSTTAFKEILKEHKVETMFLKIAEEQEETTDLSGSTNQSREDSIIPPGVPPQQPSASQQEAPAETATVEHAPAEQAPQAQSSAPEESSSLESPERPTADVPKEQTANTAETGNSDAATPTPTPTAAPTTTTTAAAPIEAKKKGLQNRASGPMSSTAVLLVLALTVSTVIGMTVV